MNSARVARKERVWHDALVGHRWRRLVVIRSMARWAVGLSLFGIVPAHGGGMPWGVAVPVGVIVAVGAGWISVRVPRRLETWPAVAVWVPLLWPALATPAWALVVAAGLLLFGVAYVWCRGGDVREARLMGTSDRAGAAYADSHE